MFVDLDRPLNASSLLSASAELLVKVATSKFYAFLVVFHTFSPTYAYVFFRVCRHHSTKSAKWGGHLIPFAPLVCKWGGGQLPPLPPGSAAYAVWAWERFPKMGALSQTIRAYVGQCVLPFKVTQARSLKMTKACTDHRGPPAVRSPCTWNGPACSVVFAVVG